MFSNFGAGPGAAKNAEGPSTVLLSFLFLAVVSLARFVVLCALCYDVFFSLLLQLLFFVLFFFVFKLLCMQFVVVVRLWPPFLCFDFCCSFVVLFVCFVCFCLFFALLCLLCFVCFV